MSDKKSTFLLVLITIVSLSILGLGFYLLMDNEDDLLMIDAKSVSMKELELWSEDKKVRLDIDYEYSDAVPEGKVISQSIGTDGIMHTGDMVTIVISLGTDPSKVIKMIDFTGKTKEQIEAWVLENRLTDVTYEMIYDDIIPENVFISHNIDTDTINRDDIVVFTLSSGTKVMDVIEITVPDFSTYSKTEINNWAKANDVIVKFATTNSETVAKDEFIKQSIPAGSITYSKKTIVITYSDGKEIDAVDLKGKSKSDVLLWQNTFDNRFKLKFVENFDDTIEKNYVVSNTPNSGKIKDGTTVKVIISMGKPEIPDYRNKSFDGLKKEISLLNEQGAKITLNGKQEYSDTIAIGSVISQNISGPTKIGSIVNVVYSKGKRIQAESFENKTEADIKSFCLSNGLSCKLEKSVYDANHDKDRIVSNNPNSGDLNGQTSISYILSLGDPSMVDYRNKAISLLEKEITALNEKGAKITLVKEGVGSSSVTKNNIVSITVNDVEFKGGTVKTGSTIKAVYCEKEVVIVPNYIGKIRNGDLTDLLDGNLNVTFKEGSHDDTKKNGEIIDQSVSAGETVEKGTNVVLTYSLGAVEKIELINLVPLYQNANTPAETIKTKVESYLKNQGFTNYTVSIEQTNEYSSNTIFDQTRPGYYDKDYEIIIKIAK